jgi:hypothetical protein
MSFLILFGYFRGLKLKQEKETEKNRKKKDTDRRTEHGGFGPAVPPRARSAPA